MESGVPSANLAEWDSICALFETRGAQLVEKLQSLAQAPREINEERLAKGGRRGGGGGEEEEEGE